MNASEVADIVYIGCAEPRLIGFYQLGDDGQLRPQDVVEVPGIDEASPVSMRLSLIGSAPVEDWTRCFPIDPDGRFHSCRSAKWSSCRLFMLQDRVPTVMERYATDANPAWVEIARLPLHGTGKHHDL
jgi:hypothetical protein